MYIYTYRFLFIFSKICQFSKYVSKDGARRETTSPETLFVRILKALVTEYSHFRHSKFNVDLTVEIKQGVHFPIEHRQNHQIYNSK